jgi:hypothetical protein
VPDADADASSVDNPEADLESQLGALGADYHHHARLDREPDLPELVFTSDSESDSDSGGYSSAPELELSDTEISDSEYGIGRTRRKSEKRKPNTLQANLVNDEFSTAERREDGRSLELLDQTPKGMDPEASTSNSGRSTTH